MKYIPCQSQCNKTSDICSGCGRSRDEINAVKKIVSQAVMLGVKNKYDNIDQYADAIAASIKKKLHRIK